MSMLKLSKYVFRFNRIVSLVPLRSFAGTTVKINDSLVHRDDLKQLLKKPTTTPAAQEKCGSVPNETEEDEEDEWEDMFIEGPAGIEWNGPTRGGARPEPTRFGDWERKGRVSDF
jgi:hypothetical protein